MVATEVLQGHWNQVRGEIQKRWGELTGDDLDRFSGDVDSLVGEIQMRTGETRQSIESFLEDVTAGGASAVSHAGEAAKHYASRAAEGVTAASTHLAEGARTTYRRNQEFVREQPGVSVGIAFTTGLIVGFAFGLIMTSH